MEIGLSVCGPDVDLIQSLYTLETFRSVVALPYFISFHFTFLYRFCYVFFGFAMAFDRCLIKDYLLTYLLSAVTGGRFSTTNISPGVWAMAQGNCFFLWHHGPMLRRLRIDTYFSFLLLKFLFLC